MNKMTELYFEIKLVGIAVLVGLFVLTFLSIFIMYSEVYPEHPEFEHALYLNFVVPVIIIHPP